jgi:hypothetical protein
MTYARSVFVIHNMAHQGRGPFVETDNLELSEHYKEQFRLFDPIGGEHMNIMKAGLQNAHSIIAVSGGLLEGSSSLARSPCAAALSASGRSAGSMASSCTLAVCLLCRLVEGTTMRKWGTCSLLHLPLYMR